jgi:outer membrane receptor protein involved in Fe transport
MTGRSKWLGATALACATALGMPAAAAQDNASAPAAAAQDGTGLGEIIVTAQRRSENLMDVPVAVTAVTADDLSAARVDNIANIGAISPSISFSSTNSPATSANIQIRGIGTVGNNVVFEGAVGVFVDGVYRSRAGQVLANFLDIGDMQILRGPQGTLFGKNTSAGALLLTSTKPSTTDFSANYELTVANYDTQLVRGAFNAPLTDKLGVRIAAMYSHNDGVIRDPRGGSYNGGRSFGFKFQTLLEPSYAVRLHFIADYAESQNNCCYGNVDVVDGPTQPLINALSAALGNPLVNGAPLRYRQTLNQDTDQEVRDRGVMLIGEFDLGGGTLTSTTAYRRWDAPQRNSDSDFSGADIINIDSRFSSKQFSQELVYNDDIGDVAEYVLGAYYANEKIATGRDFFWGSQAQAFWNAALAPRGIPAGFAQAPNGELGSSEIENGKSTSYAAFMHWTVHLGEKLSLIAGARYTREEKDGSFRDAAVPTVSRPVFTLLGLRPGPAYDAATTDNALSGTLGLRYEFSSDATAYLTYSRGFKAGGVNLDGNAAGTVANNPAVDGRPLDPTPGVPNRPLDPTYRPEKIDGFEAGLKLRWLDGRARTSMAAFYNDISDLQVAQFLGLQFAIINAKSAKSYGAEIENEFQLTDSLNLQLAGTWLPKADFGNDPRLGIQNANPVLGGLAERRFSRTPKFAGNAAINLDQPISSRLAITGRAAVQYFGSHFTNTANNLRQDGYALLDFSIGLKAIDDRWSLSAYCSNCTDKRYLTQHFNTPLQTGDVNAYVGTPRQYGVMLRGKF